MNYAFVTGICACLVGTAAFAQITTTCNHIGNSTFCNTSAPPPLIPSPIPQPVVPSLSASDFKAVMDSHRQRENERLQQIVGQMVLAGQCSNAKATALNAGDFDLAQKVHAMCHPVH